MIFVRAYPHETKEMVVGADDKTFAFLRRGMGLGSGAGARSSSEAVPAEAIFDLLDLVILRICQDVLQVIVRLVPVVEANPDPLAVRKSDGDALLVRIIAVEFVLGAQSRRGSACRRCAPSVPQQLWPPPRNSPFAGRSRAECAR